MEMEMEMEMELDRILFLVWRPWLSCVVAIAVAICVGINKAAGFGIADEVEVEYLHGLPDHGRRCCAQQYEIAQVLQSI